MKTNCNLQFVGGKGSVRGSVPVHPQIVVCFETHATGSGETIGRFCQSATSSLRAQDQHSHQTAKRWIIDRRRSSSSCPSRCWQPGKPRSKATLASTAQRVQCETSTHSRISWSCSQYGRKQSHSQSFRSTRRSSPSREDYWSSPAQRSSNRPGYDHHRHARKEQIDHQATTGQIRRDIN